MGMIFTWGVRLRIFCSSLCLAALLVMIFSAQNYDLGGYIVKARYHYSTAFTFLAGVDGVVCGCSLLSLIYVFLLSRSKPHPNSCFKLFVHDLAMLMLMVAGCASGTAIGYVGRYGQNESGWSPICDTVKNFCFKITISVVLSYIALICYLILTILTVLKLKSFSFGTSKMVTTAC